MMSNKIKERPPLTMEPSIDDPLAAVKSIMRHACVSVNNSNRSNPANEVYRFITRTKGSFFVTPAKAGAQRENMDSRLRGNVHHTCVGDNESTEAGGAAI